MALTKKVYQRINKETGQWIESVELTPVPIENKDGVYELGYQPTDDLVEADPPEYAEMVWVNGAWGYKQIEIPPEPDVIQRFLVDDDGLFVEPVLISPVLYENKWVYLGVDNPRLIEQAPDFSIGYWKPRWDGIKWVEGLTAEEIATKTQPLPNWSGFLLAYLLSDLDELIFETTNELALVKFNRSLTLLPNTEIEPLVMQAWNDCIAGLETPLPKASVKQLKAMVKEYALPVSVDAKGNLYTS